MDINLNVSEKVVLAENAVASESFSYGRYIANIFPGSAGVTTVPISPASIRGTLIILNILLAETVFGELTITDNAAPANIYRLAGTTLWGDTLGNQQLTAQYYGYQVSGGATAITLQVSNIHNVTVITVHEFRGTFVNDASIIGQVSTASSGNTGPVSSLSVPAMNLSSARELIVAGFSTSGGLAPGDATPGSGYTIPTDSGTNGIIEYKLVGGVTETAPMSWTSSYRAGEVAVAYRSPAMVQDSFSLSETVLITENSNLSFAFITNKSDSVTTGESYILNIAASPGVFSDTVSTSERTVVSIVSNVNVVDLAATSETFGLSEADGAVFSDLVGTAESVGVRIQVAIITSNTALVNESPFVVPANLAPYIIGSDDVSAGSDSVQIALQITATVSDSVTLSENLRLIPSLFVVVNDAGALSENVITRPQALAVGVLDNVAAGELITMFKGVETIVTADTVVTHENLTFTGFVFSDRAFVAESVVVQIFTPQRSLRRIMVSFPQPGPIALRLVGTAGVSTQLLPIPSLPPVLPPPVVTVDSFLLAENQNRLLTENNNLLIL